jgi:hypothetical protein
MTEETARQAINHIRTLIAKTCSAAKLQQESNQQAVDAAKNQ